MRWWDRRKGGVEDVDRMVVNGWEGRDMVVGMSVTGRRKDEVVV